MSTTGPEPIQTWDDAAENLLAVANETVNVRGKSYGSPIDHHSDTAAMWSTYLGVEITPDQVSIMFILDKIVRSKKTTKPDNMVDIAGYAQVHAKVQADMWMVDETAVAAATQPLTISQMVGDFHD